MSALRVKFGAREPRGRFGLKGPAAAGWLADQGLAPPAAPNSWVCRGGEPDSAIFVLRLGTGEFFVEDCAQGTWLKAIEPTAESHPGGVYPVLREDAAFALSGEGSLDVLAQVCNVNFADLALDARPVILTLMIGVSVLVVPRDTGRGMQYLIWCDPTFGPYLGESIGAVVAECGGTYERNGNCGGMP
jgi:sarcosine oxidase subunit gamma